MRKVIVWILEVPMYGFLSIGEAGVWTANQFLHLIRFVEAKYEWR